MCVCTQYYTQPHRTGKGILLKAQSKVRPRADTSCFTFSAIGAMLSSAREGGRMFLGGGCRLGGVLGVVVELGHGC